MSEKRKKLFISDLHLDANHPEISSTFNNLLKFDHSKTDALYILGDLFEAWIGDDDNSPFHREAVKNIREAVDDGLKIYVMHGNRDFLLGNKFLEQTGCKLLNDEEKIDVYGTPVLLMHGDSLCTNDAKYQRTRKYARNKILQRVFLKFPLSFRQQIAEKARAASKKHTSNADMSVMDVSQAEVKNVVHKHGVQFLIHGHTHQPDIHMFALDGKNCERIVLPSWHTGGNVFEWHSNGEKMFVPINPVL